MRGEGRPGGGIAVVAGYAVGVGLCFVATLGVFLQYGTTALNAGTAALVSFAVGGLLGGVWAAFRRVRV